MGVQIDHNHRYTKDERDYLVSRGRGYMIPANERRFGTEEEPRTPEDHEKEFSNSVSPFYQTEARQAAVYDKGGAPLPGAVLDYDTGRVADRENGVLVEFTGPGHTPGAFDLSENRQPSGDNLGFDGDGVALDEHGNPVDDDIDSDIVNYVLEIPNVATLKREIKARGGDYESDDRREDLENKLAVRLQDLRDAGELAPLEKGDEDPDEHPEEGDDDESKKTQE